MKGKNSKGSVSEKSGGSTDKKPESDRFFESAAGSLDFDEKNVFLQSVINNTPGGIVVLNIKQPGSVLSPMFISDNFASILGYTIEEIKDFICNPPFRFVAPEEMEKMTKHAASDIKNLGQSNAIYRYIKKNGESIWLHIYTTTVPSDDGSYVLYMNHFDVSKSIDTENNNKLLKNALSDAAVQNRGQSDFLSRMSRDIYAPLNSILDLAQSALDSDNVEVMLSSLKKIDSVGTLLASMLTDVLDMADIERGEFMLNPQVFHYDEFLNIIDALFRPKCAEKNISFNFEKGSTSLPIFIDKMRFTQLFYFVFSNAVKFTPEGGSIDYLVYNNKVEGNKLSCDFVIRDNGIGIEKDFLPYVFDPFSREIQADGTTFPGAGLGLTLSKKIVDSLGGTISVKSKKGKGTEVNIHLDMLIMSTESLTDFPGYNIDAPLAGKNVLLVSGDVLSAENAVKVLTKSGAKVSVAAGGKEAIRAFSRSKDWHFSTILVSTALSSPSARDTLSAIRSLERPDALKVPVIAITDDIKSGLRTQYINDGFETLLTRPLDPDILLLALLCHRE